MKKIYFLLLGGLTLIPVKGKGQLFNNGLLHVGPSSTLYVGDDFIQQNQLYLQGDLVLGGDYLNQSGQFTSATSGQVTFSGSATQTIGGTAAQAVFHDLNLQNAQNVLVDAGIELAVNHALHLTQGNLILRDNAQLIQSLVGANLNTGLGNLYISAKATGNVYRYHLWSSPVFSGTNTFTIASVLKDGSDSDWINNHPAVSFTNAYNGNNLTSPVTVSSYWLYTFPNSTESWKYVGTEGNIDIGFGFTMKGTSLTDAEQKYVFAGIPNNGDYSLALAPGSWTMVGNPYPSAINADKFLDDNNTSLAIGTGIYFWDHFGGDSHLTSGYQGGYATYTKSGGTPAIVHPNVDQSVLTGTKIPMRFIPVGQGFFVKATDLGANLSFNNSQRQFKNPGTESIFMRTENLQTFEESKIRLGHEDEAGYHRQLLLAFFNHTTEGVDPGYDGRMLDVNPNDMYWMIENNEYVIQARPYQTNVDFNLGIVSAKQEIHTIMIDSLEAYQGHVILKDLLTGDTFDLTEQPAKILMEPGVFNDRFTIQVTPFTLDVPDNEFPDLKIYYLTNQGFIIENPANENLESFYVYNLIGQELFSQQLNMSIKKIELNYHLTPGIYILKTVTDKRNKVQKIQIY